jgi:hypothetical protein
MLARLLSIGAILAGIAWLHWYTAPMFGVFRLNMDEASFPETGFVLALFEDRACTAAYSLSMVATGMSTIRAAWPFVAAGMIVGMIIGYPIGELVRRKLAIEQVSRDAVRLSGEIREDAREIEIRAQITLGEAYSLYAETIENQRKLDLEKQEISAMKMIAETELEAVEGWRQKLDFLEKELIKAQAKIRRQEKKAGKPIDE